MTATETLARVDRTFYEQERKNGFTDARSVANALAPDNRTTQTYIERAVQRMPTREHLYEGAEETLRTLLTEGDSITIWTQGHEVGQIWKVVKSGLHHLRKDLPPDERNRFKVYVARNKVQGVAKLIQTHVAQGISDITFVDDKSQNIIDTSQEIETLRANGSIPQDVSIQTVWINQGRTKDQVPDGYTLDTFKDSFPTIEDIRDLLRLPQNSHPKGWLIDLDHTLLNTRDAQRALLLHVAGILEGHFPIVSPVTDELLKLNGNVRDMQALKEGMSGAQVIRVDTDTERLVIKHNPTQPHKIHNEIDAYKTLAQSPLANRLLTPRFASQDHGVLVLPFYEGTQLREGLKTGSIDRDTALGTLQDLLGLKKAWWAGQEKTTPNGTFISMQRSEWQDTFSGIQHTLEVLSQKYGVSVGDLFRSPLQFGDFTFPSLQDCVEEVSKTLLASPPYGIVTHNDATGANILVNPLTRAWKLIDAEWAGIADPAESLVRMIKYISTTTIQEASHISLAKAQDVLHAELDIQFSPTAIELQDYGLSAVPSIQETLNDPIFASRVSHYLAGSYLREVALAPKRGKPELAVFAMVKAAQSLQ